MNRADILKLTADVVTPAVFAEAGINHIPVKPDWTVDETALEAFVAAGQPDVRFFGGLKVVPVAEWDRRRKRPSAKVAVDPINRTALDDATDRDWDALAPIKTASGPVPARKLCAYAAAQGLLPQDITSTVARLVVPRGTDPVDAPPTLLSIAALEWSYDDDGEGIVTAWLAAPSRVTVPPPAPMTRAPVPSGGTPIARLAGLLQSLFSVGEMRRFVKWGPYGDTITAYLPGEPAPPADVAWAAAEQYRSHGLIGPDLFDRLLKDRPGRSRDINFVRALFC